MKSFNKIISIIVSLVLILSTIQLSIISHGADSNSESKEISMSNWMKNLPQNASIGQINLPGSHDSGTANVELNPEMVYTILNNLDEISVDYLPQWASMITKPLIVFAKVTPLHKMILLLFTGLMSALSPTIQYFVDALAQCNDMTIPEQLDSGIRSFDVRLCYDTNRNTDEIDNTSLKGDDKYYEADFLKLCHGTLAEFKFDKYADADVTIADCVNADGSKLTFEDVLNSCLDFLKENSSESVYIRYDSEGYDDRNPDSAYTKAMSKVMDEIDRDDRIVILHDSDTLPTVGEAAGKIYLFQPKDCANYENNYDVSADKKIELIKKCFEESEDGSMRQNFSKSYILTCGSNPQVHSKKDYSPRIIYTSTYSFEFHSNFFYQPWATPIITGTPKDIAKSVNSYLDSYDFTQGQYYGWICMNFPTPTAIENIVCSNIFNN